MRPQGSSLQDAGTARAAHGLARVRAEAGTGCKRVVALPSVPGDHALEILVAIGQPPLMRDQLAGLEHEGESGRYRRFPPLEHLRRGRSVEGKVDLDGIEPGGVIVKPVPRRQPLGIEDSLPVTIREPGRPDRDQRGPAGSSRFRFASFLTRHGAVRLRANGMHIRYPNGPALYGRHRPKRARWGAFGLDSSVQVYACRPEVINRRLLMG